MLLWIPSDIVINTLGGLMITQIGALAALWMQSRKNGDKASRIEAKQDVEAGKTEVIATRQDAIASRQETMSMDQAHIKSAHAIIIDKVDKTFEIANGKYATLEAKYEASQQRLIDMQRIFDKFADPKIKGELNALKDRQQLVEHTLMTQLQKEAKDAEPESESATQGSSKQT